MRQGLVATAMVVAASAMFTATEPHGSRALGREVAPIECWWKTDQPAIHVGERLTLTLTCATVETDALQVVVDESGLGPTALRLSPFETLDGQRHRDLSKGSRRYFQYQYVLRLLGEDYFGGDVTLPRTQISYRVQNTLSPGSSLTGSEALYWLPAMSIRVASSVPRGASDIRDAVTDSFGDASARRFRSNLFLVVALVAFCLAGLTLVVIFVQARPRRTARQDTTPLAVPASQALGAASSELANVHAAVQRDGWHPEQAERATAALRLAGAAALGHIVARSGHRPDAEPREGEVVLKARWSRKRVVVSAAVTSSSTHLNGSDALAGWEGIRKALSTFTVARYGRAAAREAEMLDAALADGREAIWRARRQHRWARFSRRRGKRPSSERSASLWTR